MTVEYSCNRIDMFFDEALAFKDFSSWSKGEPTFSSEYWISLNGVKFFTTVLSYINSKCRNLIFRSNRFEILDNLKEDLKKFVITNDIEDLHYIIDTELTLLKLQILK